MSVKVGVLMGGPSAEREISLLTGEEIYNALVSKGYDCVKIDLDQNVAGALAAAKPDLAFLALHGKHGEDGTIQGLLEILGIPYTGSGVLASALAMDKIATKKMLLSEGFATPEYALVAKARIQAGDADLAGELIAKLGLPLVVKPPRQGSSIGMSIVKQAAQLRPALNLASQYDPSEVLVEAFIDGKEIHAAVLGNETPLALPLIEVDTVSGVYDYEAKYTEGMSSHTIPPRMPEDSQAMIQTLAVRIFKSFGCRGLARLDFRVDQQGRPFILEINTIPGMTSVSLCPDAARAAGIEFPELVERMVKLALDEA